MANFVLVHGAWHGGWCYARVRDRLFAMGHRAFTPTLTGLGERSHLLDESIDLHTHVKDVANVIRWENLVDVTLVGHSYGGRVVAGAVEELGSRISSVVLIDSPLAESGEPLAKQDSPRAIEVARARSEGRLGVRPPRASEFSVMTDEDRRWVDAKMTDHPIGVWSDRLELTAALDRVPRKTYVWASRSQFPDRRAEVKALCGREDWVVRELPCGHDVMVDMPDDLVKILITVCARRTFVSTKGDHYGVEG